MSESVPPVKSVLNKNLRADEGRQNESGASSAVRAFNLVPAAAGLCEEREALGEIMPASANPKETFGSSSMCTPEADDTLHSEC